MATDVTPAQYVTFAEIAKTTGLTPRKINYRVVADRIPVYIDSRDRRKRMIEARDLAKLVEVRSVPRRETAA